VLGVPFFSKLARVVWCSTWASLLHTWNVARGFEADTLERTLRFSQHLSFDPLGAPGEVAEPVLRRLAAEDPTDTQRTGYSLLTQTTAAPGLSERLQQFRARQAEFVAHFTRPHFDNGRLCFFQVRQPLTAAQPGCICDHVLVNVHTSEVLRLQVSATEGQLKGDLIAALRRFAPPLVQDGEAALVYAKRLLPSAEFKSLSEALDELVPKWTAMTKHNPTLFVACDAQLVEQLLAQKAELKNEIKRLQAVECDLDPNFEAARADFLDQVTTGLARVPFFPDVMLRRLLVRAFAENWLTADRLLGIFQRSLGLAPLQPQASVFSVDPKPRVPFTGRAGPRPASSQRWENLAD
jgi:hypothetical protein